MYFRGFSKVLLLVIVLSLGVVVILSLVYYRSVKINRIKSNTSNTSNTSRPEMKEGDKAAPIYELTQRVSFYSSDRDLEPDGYLVPGKKFVILADQDPWIIIQTYEDDGAFGEGGVWAKKDELNYKVTEINYLNR